MDIGHGVPFASYIKIYVGNHDDIVDATIIIITMGAGQKPGESILNLVHKNVAVYQKIIPKIARGK